jgi:hypothetical protein
MMTADDSLVDAIVAAYLADDIGEALRLVALRLERDRAELAACADLDAARRAELERSFCALVRDRLLV